MNLVLYTLEIVQAYRYYHNKAQTQHDKFIFKLAIASNLFSDAVGTLAACSLIYLVCSKIFPPSSIIFIVIILIVHCVVLGLVLFAMSNSPIHSNVSTSTRRPCKCSARIMSRDYRPCYLRSERHRCSDFYGLSVFQDVSAHISTSVAHKQSFADLGTISLLGF